MPYRFISVSVALIFTCLNSSALKSDNLLGCWIRDKRPPFENIVTICFAEDGTVSGSVLEPTGEGQELDANSWKMENGLILIGEKACKLQMPKSELLYLQGCTFHGSWRRSRP